MATKTRTSSSVGPVHDYFEPSTELSENNEVHSLRILLPGFTRDQIKITFMTYTRMLNVSGKRPIDSDNNRWIHFDQSYPIPRNCDEGKLKANLSEGVLIITMAKKILSQHSPRTEAQQKSRFPSKKQVPRPNGKTQEKPTDPTVIDSKPEKVHEKIQQKYGPTQVEDLRPETRKTTQEPRTKEAQEGSPHKYTPVLEGPAPEKTYWSPQGFTQGKSEEKTAGGTHDEEIPFKFRIRRGKEDFKKMEDDKKGLKALMPPDPTKESKLKGQDETEPIPTMIKSQRKLIDKTPPVGPFEIEQRPTLKFAPKKREDERFEKGAEEIEKERGTNKEEEGKLLGKPEKILKEKEIKTRQKTAEITKKENETLPTKEDRVGTIGKGIRQVSSSTSEVVTKISEGKWKEEEKPMLINMGAAILVIAAIGVYVSYKVTSSGST
ncbi:inactive protein RESTRICTED TEV MOVEMENT 2-like [Neltuma alba]|uniref:inactive protein RESTRICTED TEV MOVEMENT 2-like n=1 Tax=Neltuma alba TaxID=207710 RepID=UPI0010A2EE54|nr:inactive protein RESTRICTED TEV MOVEMENT 2-like [Prosopis alba]